LRALDFIQQLIDLIPDPVYLKDGDSRYLMVNESLAAERGRKKEELVGLTSFDLAPDRETAETSLQEDRAVIAGAEITKEQRARAPLTGEDCYRVVIKRRCVDINGQPVVFGLHHYITRWKVAELEYRHLAQQDPLTGIANRRHFSDEAQRAVRHAEAAGESLSLAMLDLDHFKQVNDEYGHPVGDEVLAEVVRRSLLCLRRSDLMGRWGGEEFIILLPSSDLDQACMIADRLRSAIDSAVFQTSLIALNVSISCGVAQYIPGDDLDSLIRRADRALYQAKWAGRNRVVRGLPEAPSA
jgi:diguanylate cyclase (GGDEF)-like protein/PAS domain S-box-containing protein